MGYYIGDIGYYEGDKLDYLDLDVPQRPSPEYEWSGSEWVFVPPSLESVTVSPAQIREALLNTGLLDQVESAVAAGDRKLQIWWEFATQFERSHPMVISMADSLNVTAQQLDDLFTLAASL